MTFILGDIPRCITTRICRALIGIYIHGWLKGNSATERADGGGGGRRAFFSICASGGGSLIFISPLAVSITDALLSARAASFNLPRVASVNERAKGRGGESEG